MTICQQALSDAGMLDDLASIRGETRRLKEYRKVGIVESERRRQFAGMWFPRNVVDERQVRRGYREWNHNNGELILTNSILNALTAYLDVAEHIRACREQLDDAARRRNDVAAEDATTWLPSGYVRRSEIEQRFSDLVEVEDARLVALVGFAGMGKTSIARALTTGSPFIEFIGSKPYISHLQAALESYGLSDQIATDQNAPAMLAKLMCVNPGPRFIVLDNLQTTSELRGLVPPDTTAVVVATCRESGDMAPTWCHEIPIDIMTPDEASQLARLRIPSLNDEDARFVAESLGYYPLVINVACGYANGAGVKIRELCRSLRTMPDTVKTTASENLRNILADTVAALRKRNPIAVKLLAGIVAADDHPYATRADNLLALMCEYYGYDVGVVKYTDAISEMRRFSLIKLMRDPTYDDELRQYKEKAAAEGGVVLYASPNYLRAYIHPLVKSILSRLLQDDAVQVSAIAYECLDRLIDIYARLKKQSARNYAEEFNISSVISLLSWLHHGERDFIAELRNFRGLAPRADIIHPPYA